MKLKRFDIALVSFPFSDLSETKKRPAVVLKELEGDNTIFGQITTKRRNVTKYEIQLKKESCEGDIRFNSFLYLDMIFTLHNSLIYRKIGKISDRTTEEQIKKKLQEIFLEN
jgi:mRNA interferase MazF